MRNSVVVLLGVVLVGCQSVADVVTIQVRPSCTRVSMRAEVDRMRWLSDQIDGAAAPARTRLLIEQDRLAALVHHTIAEELARCP